MMDTLRVKFLRGTSLGGGIDAAPGDVVDLDRRLFAQFQQQGRVVVLDEAQAEPAADSPKTKKGRKP